MNDRRFDLRMPVADTALLSWTDRTGQEQNGPADLANISPSGASVRTRRPMKVGTRLSLGYQDQEFAGKVTHCTSGGSGYLVGIEFVDGYRWKPRP
jgi:hypothetical protein